MIFVQRLVFSVDRLIAWCEVHRATDCCVSFGFGGVFLSCTSQNTSILASCVLPKYMRNYRRQMVKMG